MPMQYPSRPEMKVEIAFVDNPLGNDPEDDAQLGIGGGVGLPTGWTDITAYTREVNIDRGRSNDLERVESGTASILLDNRDRRFDPVYDAGPYWDPGSSIARTNLLRNPNFQYGIGNWFAPSSTVTPVTGSFYRKGKGIQVQCISASQRIVASNYSDAVGTTTTRTAVTAGLDYTFTIWGKMTGTARNGSAVLQWYNAAGVALTTSTGSTSNWNTAVGARYRATVTATAPATATSVVPYFQISSAITTDYINVDYALLEQASTVGRFFDGDNTGCYWVNVPGDSQSVLTDGATNLIADPSSEKTLAGAVPTKWTEIGNRLTASTDRSVVGDKSFKITSPNNMTAYMYSVPFEFAAGEDINFSCFIYHTWTTGTTPQVKINLELDDDSGLAWDSYDTSFINLDNGLWTRIDASWSLANSNTLYAAMSKAGIVIQVYYGSATPNPVYVDAIMVNQGTLTQPYIDGDMSGYEWTASRSESSSQALVRPSGTLLKPRRQIQVHAVFPNDVIADYFAYDLVSGTTVQPGNVFCQFTRSGLMQTADIGTQCWTSDLNFTTTEVDVSVQVKPYKRQNLTYADALLWTLGDDIALSVYNGTLEVWINYADPAFGFDNWSREWSAPFPTTPTFGKHLGQWIKVNVIRQPFGSPGNFRYRIKVYEALGQMPVPNIWSQIGSEVVTASSSLTPVLNPGSVTVGDSLYPAVGGSVPRDPYGENNRVVCQRLVVDDKITASRKCDIMFDTYHTLFRGYTRGWRQQYGLTGNDATVPLECFDMLGIVGSMTMPTDFVTEWARTKGVWGYWKLGDAGGIAVDYSGNANDLIYRDGGRLPSVYGPLASGLSGLPAGFKQSLTGAAPALAGNMITNTSGGAVYPTNTTGGSEYTVSFWMRSTTTPGTAGVKVPLFWMSDSAYFTAQGVDPLTRQFIEIGYIHSVTNTRAGVMYAQFTNLATNVSTQLWGTTWSKPGPVFQYVDNEDPHFFTVVSRRASSTTSNIFIYMDGRELMVATAARLGNGGNISIGGRPDTVTGLTQYAGDIQDVMYFPTVALTAAEIQELYELSSGVIPETTGERAERLMDFAGVPEYLRAVDPAVYGDCGLVALEEGKSVLESLHNVEDTEAGIVFADREGRLTLRGRYFLSMNDLGVTSQADFDDANVGIGYQNLEFNLDADQLANDHTVVDDSEQENEAEDELSVAQYGRRSRTVQTLLPSSEDAYQMAIGLTNIYKSPLLRAEPFDITPTGEQWLKVMPLDIGVRMSLEATPMGIGDPIQQELALQKISYAIKPKDWRVQITGSPRPVVSYFVLDKSVLDGEDVLGF